MAKQQLGGQFTFNWRSGLCGLGRRYFWLGRRSHGHLWRGREEKLPQPPDDRSQNCQTRYEAGQHHSLFGHLSASPFGHISYYALGLNMRRIPVAALPADFVGARRYQICFRSKGLKIVNYRDKRKSKTIQDLSHSLGGSEFRAKVRQKYHLFMDMAEKQLIIPMETRMGLGGC
jgi:hypothetical protein